MTAAVPVDWARYESLRGQGLTITDCAGSLGINRNTLIRKSSERYGNTREARPVIDWRFVHSQRLAGIPWASICGSRRYSWMCNEYHRRAARGQFRRPISVPSLRTFTWQRAA